MFHHIEEDELMDAPMVLDAGTYISLVKEIGVPATFALITVALLVWFAKQHRAERSEWRDMMQSEIRNWRETMEADSKLTREAITSLRSGLSELAESFAWLDGKISGGRKRRK
jgi:hypothetical protein